MTYGVICVIFYGFIFSIVPNFVINLKGGSIVKFITVNNVKVKNRLTKKQRGGVKH